MRGFASIIGIVLALFFIAVLVVLYQRSMMPSRSVKDGTTAIDAARRQAENVERREAERMRAMEEALDRQPLED